MKYHHFIYVISLVVLSGCFSNQSFVNDADGKAEPIPDRLSVINKRPENIKCRKLLHEAAELVKKRGPVPVRINPILGLANDIDKDSLFYLEATAERYPRNRTLRTYKCPTKLEEVKVNYYLKQGPGYKPWYFYSMNSQLKGITFKGGLNPDARGTLNFYDKPPELTINIDKLYIFSLRPEIEFHNKDVQFVFSSLTFQTDTKFGFNIINRSNNFIRIKKIILTVGTREISVSYTPDHVLVGPHQAYAQDEMIVKRFADKNGDFDKWYWFSTSFHTPVTVSLLYESSGKEKTLYVNKDVVAKDLNPNI